MKILRSADLKPGCIGPCVATIGNFDGVHAGHQQIIQRLRRIAAEKKLPALLITFEPHPAEFFAAEKAPTRLTRFQEKMRLLQTNELDYVVCLRFDKILSGLSAKEFIRQILLDALQIKHLVVGDDFRFGRQRAGDFAMLRSYGETAGFGVEQAPTHEFEQERVSSTRTRKALLDARLNLAENLMEHRYFLYGRVIRGDQRGRQLGFPTANIALQAEIPLRGVFAVYVHGIDHHPLHGIANLGYRPTFAGKRLLLEVHVLDFAGDLYGKKLRVEFIERLRDEKQFNGLDELKAQIQTDLENALILFDQNRQEPQ